MRKQDFETIREVLLKPVGFRIKKYRKMRKISRQTLSEFVGVKPLQITQYETGKCDITISKVFKISECLKIPCGELLPEQINVDCLSNATLSLLSFIHEKGLNPEDILDKIKKGVI